MKEEEVNDLTVSLQKKTAQLTSAHQLLQQAQQQVTALKEETALQHQRDEEMVALHQTNLADLLSQHEKVLAAQVQAHEQKLADSARAFEQRMQGMRAEVEGKSANVAHCSRPSMNCRPPSPSVTWTWRPSAWAISQS